MENTHAWLSVSPEAKKQAYVPALGEPRVLPGDKAVMESRPHLLLEGKEESFGPCFEIAMRYLIGLRVKGWDSLAPLCVGFGSQVPRQSYLGKPVFQ